MKRDSHFIHQDAAARGDMYLFLSTVYLHPPNEELLRQIVAKEFLDKISLLFGGNAVVALREFADIIDIDKELSTLKQEYFDLFSVPTGRYVTPFEDVYRGKKGKDRRIKGPLLGEYAIAVKKLYRSSAAKMEKYCAELPTHIGVELSYMSFLCQMEADTITNQENEASYNQIRDEVAATLVYREFQIKFLKEHLNEWFPQLSRTIQTNSTSHFYRGMSMLTERFLSQDTDYLLAKEKREMVWQS